jgi:plastocyanin
VSRPRRAARAALAAVATVALTACDSKPPAGPGVVSLDASEQATFEFEIPAGTGGRIDAGEPVAILPARLDARVGDSIRIVNDDDRGHVVGPFFVGAGETVDYRFSSVGTLQGECSVHPSGQIVLVVSP